jgi:prophage tail gpP-like protein
MRSVDRRPGQRLSQAVRKQQWLEEHPDWKIVKAGEGWRSRWQARRDDVTLAEYDDLGDLIDCLIANFS